VREKQGERNRARETGREKQGERNRARETGREQGYQYIRRCEIDYLNECFNVRTVAAGVHFLPWVLPLAVMARVVSPACSTTVPLVESLQSMDISYILGYTKDMDCSKGMFINWPMMKARWSKGIWREQNENRTRTEPRTEPRTETRTETRTRTRRGKTEREQKREQNENEKRKNRTRTERTTKGIRILDGVVK
jgi:hypothetical protein